MKLTVVSALIALGLSGCAFFAVPPPPVQLSAVQLRQDYVGHEFESDHGDRIRFNSNFTYQMSNGGRGTYAITPSGLLHFVGDRTSYFAMPDGFAVGRPDFGLDFVVVRNNDIYTHILAGTNRTGLYHRID